MYNVDKNSSEQRFNMIKKHHTKTLLKAIEENKVDRLVIPFLLEITKLNNIFTSSSCSGRIMLLSTDEFENKKTSFFYKRYHRTITFEELKKDLLAKTSKDIWFKLEPFIFHIGSKDYPTSVKILNFARDFGLKRSGIISTKKGKFIVEVTSTQYISLLIKKDDEILVDDRYLKLLVDRANSKLKVNFERLSRFEKEFLLKFKN